jgi:GAF domain-containing protein
MRIPGTRAAGEELVATFFEAMHELHFMRDALEGGDFCLMLAMDNVPCQVGLVHLYDIDRREFVVTSARGNRGAELLATRHAETDAMLRAAMRRRRAVLVADVPSSEPAADGALDGADAAAEAARLPRYASLGGARSVVVAPAMQAGRFLGAIELLNPLDGKPFTDLEANALSYMAEQLAEFIAARGVVTDAERITAKR